MNLIDALQLLRTQPWRFVKGVLSKIPRWIPDEVSIKISFRSVMGYWPDLNNPKTFNEKLNWLKLHDRRPEYTQMVDKYAVKGYVSSKIGSQYIIPTIGKWSRPKDVEWDKLPDQFVLKTTHGGGGCGIVICEDKEKLNKQLACRKLSDSMKSDIFWNLREWPYKNVKKQIIAEKFIESKDPNGSCSFQNLKDYKFFCFNGTVKCFKIDFNRFISHRANYYNPNGEMIDLGEELCPPDYQHIEEMPSNLKLMISLAEKLSEGIPFIRVDLYNVNGRIYFGELTFFPAGGIGRFIDPKWDNILGEWIDCEIATVNE